MTKPFLVDWLVYYIQAAFFVKGFVRPILQSFCNFCLPTFLTFAPFGGARANYIHSLGSVKGFLWLISELVFLFRAHQHATHNSEAELYARKTIRQGDWIANPNILRLKNL
ncbi:MAG: hypothetical protein DDG60_00915 [Anaerolineae bacterium]|nr:MAG: hypothetical protein DDG60_00915 [Anaerolineae bacterium]